jgi:hypothetical protein
MNEPIHPIPLNTFRNQLNRLFGDRGRRLLRVLHKGRVYRVEVEDEPQQAPIAAAPPPRVRLADPDAIWKDYDPEKVLHAMHEAAGLFAGVDREQLLRDLREQREQDSTGRPAD